MAAPVLFLFTKTFPFGKGEQYIEEELPYLDPEFSKIIFIPCSIFGNPGEHQRKLPKNSEVFLVNNHLGKKTAGQRIRNFFLFLQVFFDAALHNRDGGFFWKQLRVYTAIFKQQLACADAVRRFIQRGKHDPVHSVFYSYWVHNSCIILGILKKRRAIPGYVTRAHSYDLYHRSFYPEKADKTPLAWERFKFKTADKVFCISGHGAEFLRKKYPQWQDKFEVGRLGVHSTEKENPMSADPFFRIVTCSTVQPLKRLEFIPQIMALLDFPVEWIHFGAGEPLFEKTLKDAWEKFRRPEHRFVFRGFTPNATVKEFYSNVHIDLFMNLSIAEGVPVSLMEAASYGIPLLATDVYGTAEIVDARAGMLVPKSFTIAEVADAISSLKNNPALADRLRKGAREVQQALFDSGKNFSRFAEQIASGL
jgi:glycosyltransferase involved in cell wall biosynthesis